MQVDVVEHDHAEGEHRLQEDELGGDRRRLAQEDAGAVEARQAEGVAGVVVGLDHERPLDGQEPGEQHGHPEQPGADRRERPPVGVQGEGEHDEDEQCEGHDLVDVDPRAGLDPQVLARDQDRVTPHGRAPARARRP